MPGQSDASCVRNSMRFEGWDFDGAMSRCTRFTQGYSGGPGVDPLKSQPIPFDFRSDPELQAMAENPSTNPYHRPFVPRSSEQPAQGLTFRAIN